MIHTVGANCVRPLFAACDKVNLIVGTPRWGVRFRGVILADTCRSCRSAAFRPAGTERLTCNIIYYNVRKRPVWGAGFLWEGQFVSGWRSASFVRGQRKDDCPGKTRKAAGRTGKIPDICNPAGNGFHTALFDGKGRITKTRRCQQAEFQ